MIPCCVPTLGFTTVSDFILTGSLGGAVRRCSYNGQENRDSERSGPLQRVTWLGKAVVAGAAPQPPGTWELGNVTTHLADEGQLQGDIEDDLGVLGRQLLGSVWGEGVTGQ